MVSGIERYPLTGIGFGVPSEGGKSGKVVEDPIFGLPIMATMEKGVLPVAIIEELGYPLGILVYGWFAWLFSAAVRGGAVSVASFSAVLAVNFAECVFFSPGGLGLYTLVFACLALTAAGFKRTATWRSVF